MSDEKKIKVMIVEDEPALRDIYSTKLEMEGFEVTSAGDGVEGLSKIIETVPDIVLLDVVLPVKDGFQVLQDLKSNPRTEGIPVIIMSNLGQNYEVKRGLSLGAEDFLTKADLTPDAIIERIREVLTAKK